MDFGPKNSLTRLFVFYYNIFLNNFQFFPKNPLQEIVIGI